MKLSDFITLGAPVKTRIFLLLLMLMFLDYSSYGYYVFYLPFIYFFLYKGVHLLDTNFLILSLWGICYSFINYMNTDSFSYATIIMPIVNIPILYLFGKYLAFYNDKRSYIIILFLLSLSLGLLPLFSILLDVFTNGFVVSYRGLQLIGSSTVISATGMVAKMLPLISFIGFLLISYKKTPKIVFVTFALLALSCAIRVQSRTVIVGCVALLFVIVLLTWKERSFSQRLLLILGLFLIISASVYIILNFSSQLEIINRFYTDEVESGGGRLERLIIVAQNMFNYPFGNMPTNIVYAHNLWFDCARVAGLVPFAFLLVITIKYIYDLLVVILKKNVDFYLRYTLLLISFALFIAFIAEPILEGVPMCFGFFCLLFGLVSELKRENKLSYSVSEK